MIARSKILQNAKDLITDSEILLDNQRYSRAYTISHLASKELAKLTTMHGICIDVLSGETINWTKVDKKLRDHKDKIKRAFQFDLFCDLTSDSDESLKQYDEGIALVDEYNIMKNASIYSGMLKGYFCSPSEIISEEIARKMLLISKNRYEWYQAAEKSFSKIVFSDGGKQRVLEHWKEFSNRMEKLIR